MYYRVVYSFAILALFCGSCLALGTRLNPHIVEDGTHIDKNDTHISFHQPSGSVIHYLLSEWQGGNQQHHPTNQQQSSTPSSEERKRDSTSSGWVSSFWSWGTSYTYFSAQWTVPNAPTSSASNIVFFFNSFEGATNGGSGSDILQPVLQYNNGVSGWTLASWYGSAQYTESTPVAVNVGDTITGVMQLSGGVWSVLGYVNGVLKTTLTISQSAFNNGVAQNTAQWALEVYNMPDCTYYPPDNFLSLTNIVLQDQGVTVASPSWSVPSTPNAHGCNAAGYISTAPTLTSASTSSSTLTITWASTKSVLGSPQVIAATGIDISGGDIGTVSASSALACAQACDGNSACQGWSWDSAGKVTCWLKSSVSSRTSNGNRISGVKQGQVGIDRAGSDLQGSPITLPAGSTAATCAAYCNGNAACESWSYNTCGPNQCWLKGVDSSTTNANTCRTSGVKGILFTDHVGGDLSSSVLANGADTTQCAKLCASTSGCTNWVYVKPGVGCETQNTCWLKSGGLAFPSTNACRVAGKLN